MYVNTNVRNQKNIYMCESDSIQTVLFKCTITLFESTQKRQDHLITQNKQQLQTTCLYKVKLSCYRPGVAQRVRRVTALLFHDCSTRRG